MARQEYKQDQSINSMTTRQLRKYVADQAAEAEERINTAPDKTSKAFRDAAHWITYRNGKVIKSTSNLSKAEMQELAYNFRNFNSLDYESGFAKSKEWAENKRRYQSFIKNHINDPYWSKYVTKKGNISKKGYQDYKDFVNLIKSADEYKAQFGYRTIKKYAAQALNKNESVKLLSKTLSKVWAERKPGESQKDLIERFESAYYDAYEQKVNEHKVSTAKVKSSSKRKKSKTEIKKAKARKMKEHGKVHRTSR